MALVSPERRSRHHKPCVLKQVTSMAFTLTFLVIQLLINKRLWAE
jgi:hypothetical protein